MQTKLLNVFYFLSFLLGTVHEWGLTVSTCMWGELYTWDLMVYNLVILTIE